MYVCVCKGVTDSQIKNAINSGVCTRRQLFHCFGVGGDCGKCNKYVKELLDDHLQQQPIMRTAANQPVLNALFKVGII
ncbi:bacterioferritin-associated ferredoxin [Methylobacter sp. S3L5C]|uniref:(2Fe-2S)-binding protein n=1 Tax=Methylobacter sp. S3L5C TaxID=2839024 RepID=UPI001FAD131C|nr:(2Fe-2S)-binding protein [Methylobacter sp. S3L5C]UOA07196.1 (2Fe-2S)-binding protein [Methylobacter sp. S3L5C]